MTHLSLPALSLSKRFDSRSFLQTPMSNPVPLIKRSHEGVLPFPAFPLLVGYHLKLALYILDR